MIEGQMTLEEIIKKQPKEARCKNCIYWQLLPVEEIKEGWTVDGECLNPNYRTYTTSAKSRCREFKEWEKEPDWRKQAKKLKEGGKNEWIKKVLDIKSMYDD